MAKPNLKKDKHFLEMFSNKELTHDGEKFIRLVGRLAGRPLKVYPYYADSKYNWISYKYRFIAEHRAVWLYYNGPIPEEYEINHLDGNKRNNKLENLECCPRRQNVIHAIGLGLRNEAINSLSKRYRGSNNPNALFSINEIQEIRLLSKTQSCRELADRFGCCKSTIRDIVLNKRYTEI